VLAPAPINPATAAFLIDSLRGAPLLAGERGRPLADKEALADALSALSFLAAAHRGVVSAIDISPVIVGRAGEGVCAVDAVVHLAAVEGTAHGATEKEAM
jgi:acetate---CoA ligase (ADP-forming)